MGNDRGQTQRRRIDVPITARQPQRQRQQAGNATNQAWVDAAIVIVSTLLTTVLLLAISGQLRDTTAAGLIAQSSAPALERITAPTPQASLPLLANAGPAPGAERSRPSASPTPADATPAAADAPDDTEIQAAVDKKLQADPKLSLLGITTTVSEGKVMLVGTAPSDEMKAQVEKLVRGIKGVKQVDNQIVVITNA